MISSVSSISSVALWGMNSAMRRMDASAQRVADPVTPVESLAADVVEQRQDLYSFKANVLSLRTADEMMGSLLDVVA